MQPSSPTYASACHSRPFPLSSGLKVHMGTLPSSLHPSKSPLPSPWIPPSLWSAPSASRLSLPACSVSLCAALAFGGAARNAFALPCLSACSFRCVSLRFLQPGMWERGRGFTASGQSRGLPPAPGGLGVPALVQGISAAAVRSQESEMLRGLFQARTRRGGKGKGADGKGN